MRISDWSSDVCSSDLLARGTHDDVATRGTGNRTANCDQAALSVDLDHFQTLRGLLHGAHVTGHLLARKHAAWCLPLADGTRPAMRQRVAVSGITHDDVPGLDRPLKVLAIGVDGNVHDLPTRQHI